MQNIGVYLCFDQYAFVMFLVMLLFLNCMCTGISPVALCTTCVQMSTEARRQCHISLELELQMVMSCSMGAMTQTKVLWKGSECS